LRRPPPPLKLTGLSENTLVNLEDESVVGEGTYFIVFLPINLYIRPIFFINVIQRIKTRKRDLEIKEKS